MSLVNARLATRQQMARTVFGQVLVLFHAVGEIALLFITEMLVSYHQASWAYRTRFIQFIR